MVDKKSSVSLAILVLLITALLCFTSVAAAEVHKAQRYRVVKHTRAYDVVKGHGKKLRVAKHSHYVKVHGKRRYEVIARRLRSVTLLRLSTDPSSRNTPITVGSVEPFGQPASASTSQLGYEAARGDDGQTTTRWSADSRSYPQWWMVDLGSTHAVTGVKTNWYTNNRRSYRYLIQTSLDGVTFSTAADRSANQVKGETSDAMNVPARYIRVKVLGASIRNAWASVNEATVYVMDTSATTPTPTPTATATVTPTPTPTATATTPPTPTPTPTATSTGLAISSLSTAHAAVGASVTITGSGFGATQGTGTVTFGERPQHTFIDGVTLTPCSRTASVTSWSDTQIVVTVPSMSPGLASAMGTHHPVYVTTASGSLSNSSDFYIDPAIVIDGSTSAAVSSSVLPYSVRTLQDVSYANTSGSRHSNYTTHVIYDATTSNPAGGNFIAANTHDVLFRDCTFTDNSPLLNGHNAGVLTIGEGATNIHNITFENCVFTNNTSSGGDGTGVNGVKTYHGDNAGKMGDWTFSDCSFGTPGSPNGSWRRMSLEVNEDDAMTSGYIENIRVTGCDFEPASCEPISFNCRQRGPDRKVLIDNCTFKGCGVGTSSWSSAVFETTGNGTVIRDSAVWAWTGALFNLSGWGTGIQSHMYFKNISADQTHLYQNAAATGSVICAISKHTGAVWDNCDFNTGHPGNCCAYFANHGDVGYGWSSCTYEDLSTSYIHGYVSWQQNAYGIQPTKGADYWLSYDCNPNNPVGAPLVAYAGNNVQWPHFGTRP